MVAEESTVGEKIGSRQVQAPPPGGTSIRHVLKHNDSRRALFAVVPTLTLGIIGGAVLPLSWAFSVTGIICGVLIMVIVAAANAYTSDLLLAQAHATGTYDYETLAAVIGGKWWKLATEISIVVLMIGSIVGSMSQIGQTGASGFLSIWPHLPNWFVGSDGRLIIAVSVVVIVAPLCLVNKLRQLEYAGIIGTAIVLWLMVTVVVDSTLHGLPSIKNHQLATVGFSSIGNVTQAVSIFGFAFYIQPMMMPMLGEVPEGKMGVKIVSYSTRIVVLINAFFIYFFTGFFGAAYYGQNTESNILQNVWLGGGVAQGILNLSMAAYLAIANPVLEFPTRHTIEGWIPQRYFKNKLLRHILITTLILGFSLAIALAVPNSSGDILVVTGATGVCMVSYIIPVVNHLVLYYNRSKFQRDARAQQALRSSSTPNGDVEGNKGPPFEPPAYREPRNAHYPLGSAIIGTSRDVVLPVVVLVIGLFCSIASLFTL